MVYQAMQWSIELAEGWTPSERDDHIAVQAPTHDAEFRVSTFSVAETGTAATAWIEAATHFNRRRGHPVDAVSYGEFHGYRTEMVAGGRWYRGHVLRAGEIPLDVTYSCPESIAHRDEVVLDAMLATLRLREAAG